MNSAESVGALYEAGRAAWPEIDLDQARFAAHLARLEAEPDRSQAADLYLACACTLKVPGALEAFEVACLAHVPGWVRRYGADPQFLAEVCQALRTRLLVGEEGALPRIAAYGGRGPLNGWVRVAAVRLALALREREGRRAPEEPFLARAASTPELAYIRRRHRQDFLAAFRDAFLVLEPSQRTILRLHYLDGLALDALAPLFGVGRSTVHRRLVGARDRLYEETASRLRIRLRLNPAEVESLVGLVRSQLDCSLSALLTSAA